MGIDCAQVNVCIIGIVIFNNYKSKSTHNFLDNIDAQPQFSYVNTACCWSKDNTRITVGDGVKKAFW